MNKSVLHAQGALDAFQPGLYVFALCGQVEAEKAAAPFAEKQAGVEADAAHVDQAAAWSKPNI